MCLKAEMEVAMKLLEKDIHEKQDTIISLRRQLDDIKLINLEMYKKLQVSHFSCLNKFTNRPKLTTLQHTLTNMFRYKCFERKHFCKKNTTNIFSCNIDINADYRSVKWN